MSEWTEWHEKHQDKIELIPGIDCWIWSAGTVAESRGRSHGRVRFQMPCGEKYSEYAHRAAYISAFGVPHKGRFVCHRCGVGLCVRPSHMYVGTAADNGKDMADMGAGTASLTYDQAFDVRLRYQRGEALQNIADRYRIAFGTVYPIVMGKSYKHVPFPPNYRFGERFRKPLTQDDVADIRLMLSNGWTQRQIATKHNVAASIISRIKTGARHKGK